MLRKITPRKGTETLFSPFTSVTVIVKEDNSPKGDGNGQQSGGSFRLLSVKEDNSPKGDGNSNITI